MSIIFGVLMEKGDLVAERQLLQLAVPTERYAPDGRSVVSNGRIGMGFQPYHTHERSRLESRPITDVYGNMLSLDGRLDNHAELRQLLDYQDDNTPDSVIMLSAFVSWGEECFSRFVGDWAVVLWSERDEKLYLARDHAGTRTLYFSVTQNTLQWSTYLETFFAGGEHYSLDETYAARYLAAQPIHDLTPFSSIKAVPPAHYLVVLNGKVTRRPHWSWMIQERLCYKSDGEYDDQFIALFQQSVERRTGAGAPILAQLSGGMDSTSIVCMSDYLKRSRGGSAELLDTISFYDSSEPNWNELPYFALVEERRGKVGIHVETHLVGRSFESMDPSLEASLLPGADRTSIDRETRLTDILGPKGYRTILSGIGGDEILGGVPTPLPELADLLRLGKLIRLLKQSTAWSLANRRSIMSTLNDLMHFYADLHTRSNADRRLVPPWIKASDLDGDKNQVELVGAHEAGLSLLPSAKCNGLAWWSILETQPHIYPAKLTRREYRYPYLDRELVEFLFRVPRERLVRPGRRRALMRRALAQIVPSEILERRRKSFLSRSPLFWLHDGQQTFRDLIRRSSAASRGLLDPLKLLAALDLAVAASDLQWSTHLIRFVWFELWLEAAGTKLTTDCSFSQSPTPVLVRSEQTSSK
jgi:asparagine synthase (glutamine-hydrolysing)